MDGGTSFPVSHRHVLIIGGGASGALMAVHLLRSSAATRVTIVERSQMLGCGVAYSTENPDHLLNTRAQNMSAFPDDPDHFVRWLAANEETKDATPTCFVGRQIYGRYLASLIAIWRDDRLRCVAGECLKVEETSSGIAAQIDDGTTVLADLAILATGHAVPGPSAQDVRSGWDFSPPSGKHASVVIIGTGLSMVDHIVSLLGNNHRGPVTCLSRRGLLPQVHAEGHASPFSRAEVPLGASVSHLLKWLRSRVRATEVDGGTWRDVVDGLRPHVTAIWRAWDTETRRRFLRHAASWWEVHRHRMPPQSAELIARARASGQLEIVKARFDDATHLGVRTTVLITPVGAPQHPIMADHVIDCRGIRRNPATDGAPVIVDLLKRGVGRLDALNLGVDTTEEAQLVSAGGLASEHLFAIGPCARGALWEITAIPDIRAQCAALADTICR
ncbi:hypothetical protein P775_00515 [Puniceibacterium antarcticum]|uniref:FAD-dependent urate hydroxylase HpyO/Asp monooxygenase CreE-like FAD/NAD(P)-binding domain-containing protein n=2 Tax=Puniceibacterium antarcticum TaxID=1206336 RepID=A0A2G8RKX4_9RHOB|nr:FAD/NAD(P)-binding protein [Puniceibacterium antarcticum]PIL22199.1 hypothetical protein P775_00515 [Puniceibacterium antarcticum]